MVMADSSLSAEGIFRRQTYFSSLRPIFVKDNGFVKLFSAGRRGELYVASVTSSRYNSWNFKKFRAISTRNTRCELRS